MSHYPQNIKSILVLTCFLVITGISTKGQVRPPNVPPTPVSESSSGGTIRGRIVLPGGGYVTGSLRVTLQTNRGVEATVFSDNEGHFEFTRLNPGTYQVIVEGDKSESTTESVQVLRGSPAIVTINLNRKADAETKLKAKTVSTEELDPDIPGKAKKEFELASVAAKDGKREEAIRHLRRAIDLYPRYMVAHNDLGAQLLEQGQWDEAQEALRRALELAPKAFNPNLNLGIVLVNQQRFIEAAEFLNIALTRESSSPTARLYLGLAMLGLNDLDGAERELKTAHDLGGGASGLALFHLGQLYMNKGEQGLARKMFELYLQEVPNAANTAQVQKLLALLR